LADLRRRRVQKRLAFVVKTQVSGLNATQNIGLSHIAWLIPGDVVHTIQTKIAQRATRDRLHTGINGNTTAFTEVVY
jgi:hypothetical protein